MKIKYLFTLSFLLICEVSLGQVSKIKIDSLVISSLPWELGPGYFGRVPQEIRGNNVIVVKDSTSLAEFSAIIEENLYQQVKNNIYIDPRVVIDVYYYQSKFYSISVESSMLCRFESNNYTTVNISLFRWLCNYVKPPR